MMYHGRRATNRPVLQKKPDCTSATYCATVETAWPTAGPGIELHFLGCLHQRFRTINSMAATNTTIQHAMHNNPIMRGSLSK
mmetsp:Transcript_71243/g.166802  ORF Transcript_71243/g.166802 Transcript_71243/m.166802 type:complete len:82 (+) Transcript_71243:985-1230(+)